MTLEIWILESDIKQLKKLCTAWLSLKEKPNQAIRYMTICPKLEHNWICVHISLDSYTSLIDHDLLIKQLE